MRKRIHRHIPGLYTYVCSRVPSVNCRYFRLLILRMRSVCFRFCLLCSKRDPAGHCLWGKQHHGAFHSPRNFEMACCLFWHSRRKLQYEDLIVFVYQSENSADDSKRAGWVQRWFRRYGSSEDSLFLIRKEHLNLLVRSRPLLVTILASPSGS